jgi:hypothetical protein
MRPVVEEDAVRVGRAVEGFLRGAAAHPGIEDEQRRARDSRDRVELEAADAPDDVADGLALRRDRKALGVKR